MKDNTATVDIRLIDMTQSELEHLIEEVVKKTCTTLTIDIESRLNKEQQPQPTTYYGIEGIAQALGVSKVTAQRWKTLGYLEGGYQQMGNKIVVRDAQRLSEIAEREINKAKNARHSNRVRYSIINQ